jgi:hypothetical protein
MNKNYRSIRLLSDDTATLDRKRGESGEVYYDKNSVTLRIYDAHTVGGIKLATQAYTGTAISTALATVPTTSTVNSLISTALTPYATTSSVTTALSSYALLTSPSFSGTVTGTFSGNLTGSVLGNADTATKLAASKNINGVAFDGSANITVSTLVNGNNTITLGANGNVTLPGTGQIVSTGYNANSAVGSLIIDGDQAALDYRGNNNLFVDEFGVEIYTNTTGTAGHNAGLPSDNYWAFAPDGTSTFPGNITTSMGTVAASAVTTTNDVTVGGNANISTLPTLPAHATNKKYVDTKAIALSIAMS